MGREWTPEQRAAASERAKERARLSGAITLPSPEDEAAASIPAIVSNMGTGTNGIPATQTVSNLTIRANGDITRLDFITGQALLALREQLNEMDPDGEVALTAADWKHIINGILGDNNHG